MTQAEIDQIFDRVRSWPLERQEKAMALLLALEEQGTGVYDLSDAELSVIEAAEAEAERGEFASDKEMEALFGRYRRQ
jgi:predicted transcriptional regulator